LPKNLEKARKKICLQGKGTGFKLRPGVKEEKVVANAGGWGGGGEAKPQGRKLSKTQTNCWVATEPPGGPRKPIAPFVGVAAGSGSQKTSKTGVTGSPPSKKAENPDSRTGKKPANKLTPWWPATKPRKVPKAKLEISARTLGIVGTLRLSKNCFKPGNGTD